MLFVLSLVGAGYGVADGDQLVVLYGDLFVSTQAVHTPDRCAAEHHGQLEPQTRMARELAPLYLLAYLLTSSTIQH
jgi:hypothetical protein